jgi:peroxiredoxin
VSGTPAPTPTARILNRTDQQGTLPNLLQEHDDIPSGTPDPNHTAAIQALPRVGQPAPDFTLKTLEGSTVSLSGLRGKPVVMNFWTSWCVACREEAPILQKAYAANQAHGLVILGMNVMSQDTPAAAREYVAGMKLTFPVPIDEQGTVAESYRVPGLPVTFFIDDQGVIRNVIVGQMRSVDLIEGLKLIGM